jgi:hypothetical protein
MLANQAFHLQVIQMVSRNDSVSELVELTSFESSIMASRLAMGVTCGTHFALACHEAFRS